MKGRGSGIGMKAWGGGMKEEEREEVWDEKREKDGEE